MGAAQALSRLLNKYDLDGSGVLEFDEFIQMLKPYFPPTDPKALNDAQVGQLKALFSRFDRNGDGQIDTSELKAVLEAKGAKGTSRAPASAAGAHTANGLNLNDACPRAQSLTRRCATFSSCTMRTTAAA